MWKVDPQSTCCLILNCLCFFTSCQCIRSVAVHLWAVAYALFYYLIHWTHCMLIWQPLARMGATVTGIDAVDKNIKIARVHAVCIKLSSHLNIFI